MSPPRVDSGPSRNDEAEDADEAFAVEPHIPGVVRLTFRDGELFKLHAIDASPTE